MLIRRLIKMLTKFKFRFFGIFTLVLVNLLLSPVVMAASDPYQEMKVVADKVFSSMKSQADQIHRDPNLLKALVRQSVLADVQVKYAGALILGNAYKSATDAQRTAYFSAFEKYLVQAFAQALSMYDGQDYQVETAKNLGDKTMLAIRVSLIQPGKGQPPVRLDFQWRKNTVTGEWQMYDLLAEGISMIATKQNEWSTLLRQNGIDALTGQLNQLSNKPVSQSVKKKG